jgi:choline dehydrogenase
MESAQFDYVIVGAGTAGCLLANRLSADPKNKVLLIEAGGKDDYRWIHIPVGYLYCIGNPITDWCFETQPSAGIGGRSLKYPRGRVLGGSSSINGMIYMRGQSRDYDHWAELTGNSEWRWDAALPYFMKHEDYWRGSDAFHASGGRDPTGRRPGGEWRIEKQRLNWEVLERFSEAAQQTGIPLNPDFNRGTNEGVGYFEVNQKGGFRWNASQAFLKPIWERRNLSIWTHAQAQKLLFHASDSLSVNNLKCEGVQVVVTRTGSPVLFEVKVNKEVILCSGAIGSPALLEASGVGQKDHLERLHIPLVKELPGVGENLQDHLQLRMVYALQKLPTLNTRASTRLGKLAIVLEYALLRSGPMSMAPSQLGVFTRSTPELQWPDLEYHVQPLSLEAFGQPLHPFNAFTASVCHLNPSSRGSVHVQSKEWGAAPAIQPNYLSTEFDQQVAAQALRVTRHIVSQAALQPYSPKEIKPGIDFQAEHELRDAAGQIGTTIFHPVGTCKMGAEGDESRVVDSELKVVGIRHLRVVDASIMPTITSGNTNSPVLMIAEKAAEWILRDAKREDSGIC